MKILLFSDAWLPQTNGVVRCLQYLKEESEKLGHEIQLITPDQFFSLPCPTYPEIRLAFGARSKIHRLIKSYEYDAIHIATEGPLGFTARNLCVRYRLPFTTAYHTRFPEYLHARWKIPTSWSHRLMKYFHKASKGVLVSTSSMADELKGRGFKNIQPWSRGVDTQIFKPRDNKSFIQDLRPISLYVGRVAVEKNLEDFLKIEIPGTKYVVGDGPQTAELKRKYPEVRFVGFHSGQSLAQYYSAADVFVFPSKTDTFGLVLLEALASGIPVAAYPVTGPLDVIGDRGPGVLAWNLQAAVLRALEIPSRECVDFAKKYSWEQTARQFLTALHTIRPPELLSPQAEVSFA